MRLQSRFALTTVMFPVLITLFAFLAVPAKAQVDAYIADVVVDNNTNYDAWVDYSWAYKGLPWRIEKAMCIPPHKWGRHAIRYNSPNLGPQFRLRAEIKLAGCAGGTHAVLTGVAPVVQFTVQPKASINEGPPGHFYLNFPDKV